MARRRRQTRSETARALLEAALQGTGAPSPEDEARRQSLLASSRESDVEILDFIANAADLRAGHEARRSGVVATRGAYTGKPRPALVVQSDLFNQAHASVTLCPVTSDVIDAPLFRVAVPPGPRTGLTTASQIMADKVVSVPRGSIVKGIGSCNDAELELVDDALRRWLAL